MRGPVTIVSSELILGVIPYLAAAVAGISILVSERGGTRPARSARRPPKGQQS